MMILTVLVIAVGVKMFDHSLEPALAEGHGSLIKHYQSWGYSDE